MKKKKVLEITPQLEEKIIASAYGEGSVFNNLKVKRVIKDSEHANALYEQYKTIAQTFNRFEYQECPERVIQSVEAQVKRKSSGAKLYEIIRPAFTYMILAAAMITAIITFTVDNQTNKRMYSSKEIQFAKEQLHLSLELIGKVMNKTENEITPKIINEKVGDPLKKGLPVINNSITGG
ncbi:MAG: hypothetical protein MUO34_01920 [Ignavibacteriaceae bacterium]|nr:hypothetical protein [Ignavibacteriaceae bacterium]